MSSHDDLGRTLRDRADAIGSADHPLSLDDVKGRARGIRRRRIAVSGLAAAAVVAIAVPAGLVVADRATTGPEVPPAGSTLAPDATGSPSPSGTESTQSPDNGSGVKVVALDNNTDATSDEPGIDYLVGGDVVSGGVPTTIRLPNGDEASATRRYDTLAKAGDAWLALWRDDQGRSFVDLIEPDGLVSDTRRATDTLAVSQDGSLAVYGTPDGTVVSFTPVEGNLAVTAPDPSVPNPNPVAVAGSGSCKEASPEGGGCTVWYDDNGVDPAGYVATSHGTVERLPDVRSVGGVSQDGRLAGMVSADDSGSCSVMLDQDGKEQWRTCDYRLGRFSPDGKYVLGHPAYGDGIGDSQVAILDAQTGKVLVDYRNDQVAQAFINNAVWDADGTVLATVFARGSWSLVRLTPEGDLTLVDGMQALGSDMDTPPLVLETRP